METYTFISSLTGTGLWAFLSPIISGTITALVWVLLIAIYTWQRNWRLERNIRASVSNIGLFEAIDGIGMIIRNSVHIPIIVRRVEVIKIATLGHPELNEGQGAGTILLSFMGPAEFGSKQDALADDMRNFVTLPPYTEGKWGAPSGWAAASYGLHNNTKFVGWKIIVEYTTLLRKPKLLEVTLENDAGVSAQFNKELNLS